MEFLAGLLLFILFYPIIIDILGKIRPSAKCSPALFTGTAILLVLLGFVIATGESIQLDILRTTYFNISLKLDVLSGLIATTVLTIGTVIFRFSFRYLEDDPRRETFTTHLACTLSCVLAMLMATNLVVLFLSWVGVSCFLHLLLTHFSERSGALRAAQQKFWVSRIGDFFLLCAAILILRTFNSLEFETLFTASKDNNFLMQHSLSINSAMILMALGAMAKSAQFPFHFWLPNTMETPTPVSALMHAGIINAGGYLIVRMSPLMVHAPMALSFLALVGSFTALWAFTIMLTQTSVKKSLAYSTISQMGFMMLQCGLGAFSIAVVHIMGHAFYKAYAFLSSGSATDFGKLNRYFPKQKTKSRIWKQLFVALLSIGLIFGIAEWVGFNISERPGSAVLLMIFSLAISQIILSSNKTGSSLLAAGTVIGIYLGLSKIIGHLLETLTPEGPQDTDSLRSFTFCLSLLFFIALYLLQNNLDKISNTPLGKKIYVKALRGTHL